MTSEDFANIIRDKVIWAQSIPDPSGQYFYRRALIQIVEDMTVFFAAEPGFVAHDFKHACQWFDLLELTR